MLPEGGKAGTVSADDGLRARRSGREGGCKKAARSRAEGALISALAPRTAMSHFLISDEIGKLRLRYIALVIWHVRIIVSN